MVEPGECSHSPIDAPAPCAISLVPTGSKLVATIEQCTRCGWVDPASLDRAAEIGYKRSLTKIEQRTAMAISGEPFTFVRSSDEDITLDEALGQALGAASMCWERPEDAGTFNSVRAKRIFEQLKLLLQEKSLEDRREIAKEIIRNSM